MSKKKEEDVQQETPIQNGTEDAPVDKQGKVDPVKLFTYIILAL